MEKRQWQYTSIEDTWVAIDDGEIIGCARAEFFRNGTLATLAGVYVEDSYRGKGLGIELSASVINAFPEITTWHLAGKEWIARYYAQMGFEIIEEQIEELKRDFPNQIFMQLNVEENGGR